MSTILQFPQRNKGRVRKSNSTYSLGRAAVDLAQNRGEDVSDNVFDLADFMPPVNEPIGDGRQALILAVALFNRIPRSERDKIRRETLFAARQLRNADARRLYELLTGDVLC